MASAAARSVQEDEGEPVTSWSYEARVDAERRLLAALYLWPRAVDLEPRHFLFPTHGVLFVALQELGDRLLDDEAAIPLLRALVQRMRLERMFLSVRGVENFVIEELVPQEVTPHAIDDLVAQVRECPRCGR